MKWFSSLSKAVRVEALIGVISLISGGAGFVSGSLFVCVCAGACCLVVIRRWYVRVKAHIRRPQQSVPVPAEVAPAPEKPRKRNRKGAPKTAGALFDEFLKNGRAAILLRAELASKVKSDQKQAAQQLLQEQMATVQPGKVWMTTPTKTEVEMGAATGLSADVAEVLIDRQAVTNEQFQRFVDDGGYENPEFWCEHSSAARGQFVDQTSCQGPRFWRDGQFRKGEASRPVVGVNWYEAQAYARWSGKRMLSGPEWVKAASSPEATTTVPTQQKKYPWGESVGVGQANLWQSGIGHAVSVSDYGDMTAQDIRQMIGNVWEWVEDDFVKWTAKSGWDSNAQSLKSIRGGAFDTYLATQATVQSQSGEEPFARRHNIGFRCAVEPSRLELPS